MPRPQRLDTASEPADAFIGIVTNLSIIQIAHFINQKSLLNLVREADLPVYFEKTNKLIEFKFFHCQNDDYRSDFCLLGNSNAGLSLLPSYKQFSYFLIALGAIPDYRIAQLIAEIKSISGVQIAANLSQNSIPAIPAILTDIELHLTEQKMLKSENRNLIMPLSEDQ
ncbi:MAG: IPExxxVDY family protein [Bacteroidales bacterium]